MKCANSTIAPNEVLTRRFVFVAFVGFLGLLELLEISSDVPEPLEVLDKFP